MKKIIVLILFIFFSLCRVHSQNIPKMSAWDGVAYAIKDYYESNANDPKSIKYSEASLLMLFNNGKYSQRVKIRGKNGFGATVLNENYFIMAGTGTNAKVIDVYNATEFNQYVISNNIKIEKKYNTDGSIVP